jgi:hypothetical protein
MDNMTDQEIVELAAILVNEHGNEAADVAERRRAQFERERRSDGFRLWSRIAVAVARLLAVRRREERRHPDMHLKSL